MGVGRGVVLAGGQYKQMCQREFLVVFSLRFVLLSVLVGSEIPVSYYTERTCDLQ